MAKTDGRGNPPWTRDEIIFPLDLFFGEGMVALSGTHPKVVALSRLLRGIPGNEWRAANPRFRNAAGVSFKLSNPQSLSTGRGFANGSATDRTVWVQFEGRPQRVKEVATLIVKYVAEVPHNTEDDEEEFAEGRVVTQIHRRIERNRELRTRLMRERRKAKGERRKANLQRCDACFMTSPTADHRLDDAIFDANHPIPSQLKDRRRRNSVM